MNILENVKRILVLAPHVDDGEIGCGGTIAKCIESGADVYYVAFSTCEESVPAGFPKDVLKHEVMKATSLLGIASDNVIVKDFPVRRFSSCRQEILDTIHAIVQEVNPELVFLPSSKDIHQDHAIIYEEGRRACKRITMLGYEFLWNNFEMNTTGFVSLERKHINKKVDAIAAYESQQHRFYSRDEMISGYARFRGLQILEEYAESFEIIRWIIK